MSSQSSILNSEYHWYALRITYSRELVLKEFLDKNNIENFIPMRYEYVTRKEQRIRKLVPAIHNLVFIYSTRKKIDEIKEENAVLLPLRYIMDRETKQPIIVPEIQMRHFIAIAGSYDISDLYKAEVSIDLAFALTRQLNGIYEREKVSDAFRQRVIDLDLLKRMTLDIPRLLGKNE